jgi:hypothetical protein
MPPKFSPNSKVFACFYGIKQMPISQAAKLGIGQNSMEIGPKNSTRAYDVTGNWNSVVTVRYMTIYKQSATAKQLPHVRQSSPPSSHEQKMVHAKTKAILYGNRTLNGIAGRGDSALHLYH